MTAVEIMQKKSQSKEITFMKIKTDIDQNLEKLYKDWTFGQINGLICISGENHYGVAE